MFLLSYKSLHISLPKDLRDDQLPQIPKENTLKDINA